MAHNPKAVANLFLDLAKEDRDDISPLKMQKLIYFSHGWHLAISNNPLIDEYVEAWDYGPVIPSLYHELKHFGSCPIQEYAKVYNFDEEKFEIPEVKNDICAVNVVKKVWEIYKNFSGIQLSSMTHEEDTPWAATRGKTGGIRNADIDNNLIKEYFSKLGRRKNDD